MNIFTGIFQEFGLEFEQFFTLVQDPELQNFDRWFWADAQYPSRYTMLFQHP